MHQSTTPRARHQLAMAMHNPSNFPTNKASSISLTHFAKTIPKLHILSIHKYCVSQLNAQHHVPSNECSSSTCSVAGVQWPPRCDPYLIRRTLVFTIGKVHQGKSMQQVILLLYRSWTAVGTGTAARVAVTISEPLSLPSLRASSFFLQGGTHQRNPTSSLPL